MSPQVVTVMAYVGVFAVVLSAILLFLLLWKRREDRRYRAIELAGELSAWGLDKTFGRLLLAYAVGNYFGKDSVTRTTHELIDMIQERTLPEVLKNLFKKLFLHFIKQPEDLAWMQSEIAKVLPAAVSGKAKS